MKPMVNYSLVSYKDLIFDLFTLSMEAPKMKDYY